MTPFNFAAAIAARPSGATTAQLVAAYGNPLGPGARETGGGNFEPSPAWARDNLVRFNLTDLPGFPPYPGLGVIAPKLHRLVAPVLVATFHELATRGLSVKLRTYNGSYVGRHMGHDPRRPLSVHAFGAAIDFDAEWNGYGLPLSKMQINREVVKVFQQAGWEWGGLWTDPWEDGMHFQWTDPLPGVPQPAWRDEFARAGGAAVPVPKPAPVITPAPAAAPVFLVPDGKGGWTNIAGQRIEGHFSVINATDPTRIYAR